MPSLKGICEQQRSLKVNDICPSFVYSALVWNMKQLGTFRLSFLFLFLFLGKLQSTPLTFGGDWILHPNVSELWFYTPTFCSVSKLPPRLVSTVNCHVILLMCVFFLPNKPQNVTVSVNNKNLPVTVKTVALSTMLKHKKSKLKLHCFIYF